MESNIVKVRRFKVLVNEVVKGSYFNIAVAYSNALTQRSINNYARITITDEVTSNKLLMDDL